MRGLTEGSTYVKWENEKEKLRIGGGSWSINLADCNLSDPNIQSIRFETDKAIYRIGKAKAVGFGFKRNFQGEAKLVVPIKYWEVEARK
jgi:hypothetical protein